MSKFIGYTIGLTAVAPGQDRSALYKVGYYEKADGKVLLELTSGHDLSSAGQRRIVDREVFEARPVDPYDSVVEARWAFKQLGIEV